MIIYAIRAGRTKRAARRDTNSIILHSLIDLLSRFALRTGARSRSTIRSGTHSAKTLAHAPAKEDCADDDGGEEEVK